MTIRDRLREIVVEDLIEHCIILLERPPLLSTVRVNTLLISTERALSLLQDRYRHSVGVLPLLIL